MQDVNSNSKAEGMARKPSIKTMKLYSNCERIYNELKQLGIGDKDPLDVVEVSKFDQYHYYGTEAVAEAARKLGINSTHRVLDIGSGIGGPSRYLAHLTGCHVTAVEMQVDLHHVALDLTARCGLKNKVTHLCGNFLELNAEEFGEFDFIVSWLVFLHIRDKATLFRHCHRCLKPSGKMFIEDLTSLSSSFTNLEVEQLRSAVYMKDPPPTQQEYVEALGQAGFTSVQHEDVTSEWSKFCHQRAEDYRKSKERQICVHGPQIYEEQEYFFSVMDSLFTQGHLGGCKITVEK